MPMNRTKNKNEPCPFCGNREIGVGYNDKEIGSSKWRAVCYNCGAHGPYCNTSTEAMEEWNHRFATDTNVGNKERTAKTIVHCWELIEHLCGNCKEKVLSSDDYCSHCGAKLDWGE